MRHVALSPAKVNLLLKVVSKRSDGYHNLVSVVDLISLYDVITIEEDAQDRVVVGDTRGILPTGPANTMFRAIMLLKERYGVALGVRVMVEKQIPIGAGLGGPSSNAATALKELVRIWGLEVSEPELMALGSKVGADVPLFVYGKSCVMRGVGDRVSPFPLPSIWYVLVYPGIILHTRLVYEGLRIVLTKGENDITLSGQFDTIHGVAQALENDLEPVAFSLCPEIQEVKKRLTEAGALNALMSGSGSSVFGIFDNQESAEKASLEVNALGKVFVVHSI
jgi:4-diphosphocytidyl-2-C-methyl-D-erythritol kinase